MSTSTVVTVFDPPADFDASALLRGSRATVVELGLQGREERLGYRVIPAHPGVTHRTSESVLVGEGGDLFRGGLRALIGVKDDLRG